MRLVLVFALLVVVLFSGCDKLLKEEPPPPEPEGPQTKEEVLAEITPILAPIRTVLMAGNPPVSDADRQNIMARLRDAIVQYGDKDFGKEALRELGYEAQELAKRAAEVERYRLVLICIEVSELLSVESILLERLGARADVMLDKPRVAVKGFIDDLERGDTYIFIEMINYRRGTIDRFEAREGDEFDDIRVVRIIGRNKAVLFEYLKVPGLFFEVEAFKTG